MGYCGDICTKGPAKAFSSLEKVCQSFIHHWQFVPLLLKFCDGNIVSFIILKGTVVCLKNNCLCNLIFTAGVPKLM